MLLVMRFLTPKLKKHLSWLAPVLIIFVGTLVAGIIITRHQNATKSLSACKGSQKLTCYKEYFTKKTNKDGALAAINDARTNFGKDPYIVAQCHEIMHVIGHAGFDKYKTIAEAYNHGDGFCWSGYYHGVTEEAIGKIGAEKIKQIANDICADLAKSKPYSFDHYNCAHGLGHGFMAVDNFNLFNALKTCDLLHDNWERDSCYGGVFMENVMVAVRGDGSSDYLKPDQLMYPCTAVETTYKQACYLMQTSYALKENGYNYAETFALCQNVADSAYTNTCFESIGRDASGSTASDLQKTKQNCDFAPDQNALTHCVYGAARDFTSYYHSDAQARQLCQLFDETVRTACLNEVTLYYKSF